jgi:hypothetical protein
MACGLPGKMSKVGLGTFIDPRVEGGKMNDRTKPLPDLVDILEYGGEEYMFYNSQYLIQWEMIKYGIEHGFKRYNFYGITGNFDKNDKDYGIYEFKTGFNGYVEELIGEYVYPTSFVYYLMQLIHKIKK